MSVEKVKAAAAATEDAYVAVTAADLDAACKEKGLKPEPGSLAELAARTARVNPGAVMRINRAVHLPLLT